MEITIKLTKIDNGFIVFTNPDQWTEWDNDKLKYVKDRNAAIKEAISFLNSIR